VRFPDLEEIAELSDCRERVTDWGCLEEGVYLWEDGVFFRCRVPLHQYGTLKSYFDLNFALLNHPGIYVLPGYSAEGKMHLGMNVVIMEDCVIEPPAVLCDHVRIHRGCRLTNGVIAGSNVIVDRGTELKHSVILSHTFIGLEMEIRNKIVDSGRVIDPETGAYVDHSDGITMDNRRYKKLDWIRCGEFLLALGTAVLLLIPYAICRVIFTLIKSPLWEYRLSVDRYSKFWLVLTGKGSLIRTSGDSRDSVFLPTEGFSGIMTREQIEIDDLYYRHNRSMKLIFTLLLRAFINRSMSHELP